MRSWTGTSTTSATAATIDAEGWLHTGDRGCATRTATSRILGRIKEMMIVGGFNVYPAEVEDMIREHPMSKTSPSSACPTRAG